MSAPRPSVAFVRHNYYAPNELKVKREADSLQASGFQSHVICLRDTSEPWRETVDGVHIYRMPVRHQRGRIVRYLYEYNAFFLLASLWLIWLHMRHRLSAVQVHTMPDYLVFCALVPRLTGSRVVLHVHEPMPELFGTLFERWYRAAFIALITLSQRASLAFADRATTVTREMKDTFAQHGSNVGKVTVVLNVPDDRFFRLEMYEHLRARVDAIKVEDRQSGVIRVFTHGAIEDRYGNDTIVRALPLLRRQFPGVQFRFLGKGEHLDAVLGLAAEMGVRHCVHYLGFVPFEQMIEEILAADVCVVAMKRNPYSVLVHTNKMFEYMALKRPVVASRLDSSASYFPDGAVAYFDPDNPADLTRKIQSVLNDPASTAERVATATRYYEKYRWENEKKKYLGVYEDLLGKPLVAPAPATGYVDDVPLDALTPRKARKSAA
jgi:glycosyltransferase involved in cell wall biosynthesis